MSTRFDFIPDRDNPTTLTTPLCDAEIVVATNGNPERPGDVFVGIDMHWSSAHRGEAWAAVDANELRDAIDKAAGKREGAKGSDPKPYRPIDRDRLLRHIGDIEATLARRNERWERDQERIRELEAEVFTLREIRDSCEEPKTVREYLDLAWEVAVEPEDGMIRKGEEAMVMVHGRGDGPGVVIRGSDTPSRPGGSVEYRLLEPRKEPRKEDSYRKELESKGLAEWEIQLLVGAAE